MAKIMIFNHAASSGGALTILKMYHQRAMEDMTNEYIFVVSTVELKECENVRVLAFPKTKKSWLHRWFFDKCRCKKLVKKHMPDSIISLQNVLIKSPKGIFQEVYIHQSLPFVAHKFKLLGHPRLWVYQNIIGRMIKKAARRADKITVQTQWMKKAVLQQSGANESKFVVDTPVFATEFFKYDENSPIQFFYPAAAEFYKNHTVILQALKILKEEGLLPKVIFTLDGTENKLSARLKDICDKEGLNVEFTGSLTHGDVLAMYSKSILLFPSFVESLPLPLIEAKNSNCSIICSDQPFSREVCNDYDRTVYFAHDDSNTLASEMKFLLKRKCKEIKI